MPYKDPEKKRQTDRERSASPEKRTRTQVWKAAHRDHLRWYNIKRLYGLTKEQYEEMLERQGGVCAICHLPPPKTNRQNKVLHVDHDHASNKVRALLCVSCNTAIGKLSADALERAAAYLRYHKA